MYVVNGKAAPDFLEGRHTLGGGIRILLNTTHPENVHKNFPKKFP